MDERSPFLSFLVFDFGFGFWMDPLLLLSRLCGWKESFFLRGYLLQLSSFSSSSSSSSSVNVRRLDLPSKRVWSEEAEKGEAERE